MNDNITSRPNFITVNRKAFKEALDLCIAVIVKGKQRTRLPVLRMVRVSTKGDTLTLAATDIHQWIKVDVKINSLSEDMAGWIEFPQLVSNVIGRSRADELNIDIFSEKTTITAGSSKYELPEVRVGVDEIPHCPVPVEEALVIRIDPKDFNDGITRCLHAISLDETRQVLNAAKIEVDPSGITVVATDTHKLLVELLKTQVVNADKFPTDWLVPKYALQMTQRIIRKGVSPDFSIASIDNRYSVAASLNSGGEVRYKAKCVDGVYPNYNRVVPDDSLFSYIEMDRLQLLWALERIVASSPFKVNKVSFTYKEGDATIGLSTVNMGGISVSESIAVNACKFGITTAVNAKYLLQAIKPMPQTWDTIRLGYQTKEELRPLKITVKGVDTFFEILMPMQIV